MVVPVAESEPTFIKRSGLTAVQDGLAFLADPLGFCLEIGRMAPLVQIRIGGRANFLFVTDPDVCQEVLQSKVRHFPRDRELRKRKGLETFQTVFNAPTWDEWLWRRRLLQPAFHGRELEKFGSQMVAETVDLLGRIDVTRPVEMVWLMKTLTMRIICRTMFSASLKKSDAIQESFETTTAFRFRRASRLANWPLWLPLPATQTAKAATAVRRDIINEIVQTRLSTQHGRSAPNGVHSSGNFRNDALISICLSDAP